MPQQSQTHRKCFCTTSIHIVLTYKYQLTAKNTHLETMLQFTLSTSGRCSSLHLQWASCGIYIDACNILYLQFVIPWCNTKYYDFPSKNFSYNWRWCKKALQSVKINGNLIESLNLLKFKKFVQIAKQSNNKNVISLQYLHF